MMSDFDKKISEILSGRLSAMIKERKRISCFGILKTQNKSYFAINGFYRDYVGTISIYKDDRFSLIPIVYQNKFKYYISSLFKGEQFSWAHLTDDVVTNYEQVYYVSNKPVFINKIKPTSLINYTISHHITVSNKDSIKRLFSCVEAKLVIHSKNKNDIFLISSPPCDNCLITMNNRKHKFIEK